MRLLLVEDSRDLAAWLAKILRDDSYAVDCAHDGEEADDLLRLATYDLVILDLSLPRLDGLGVLRRLLMDQDEFRGEVVYTFDGDAAGRKAAWRALEAKRRAQAEAALRRVAAAPSLSRDVNDIVARTLADT